MCLFFACGKSGPAPVTPGITDSTADILTFSIKDVAGKTTFGKKYVGVRVNDTFTNAGQLVASFTLTPGAVAKVSGIVQTSDVTTNDFNSDLVYQVTNAQGYSKYWRVSVSNNDSTVNWGLGNFIKNIKINDRPYEWYFNQAYTGRYSSINCAPTSATMGMKWAFPGYTGIPSEARDYYPGNTDRWSLGTVRSFLSDHQCRLEQVLLGDTEAKTKAILKAEIDKGNIAILALFMGNVRPYLGAFDNPKVDRYYGDEFNHCIVAYGYIETEDDFYFKVKDPWGMSYYNKDGTLSADGRYYRLSDVAMGCQNLDNSCISIPAQ